jgi:hypothetical protein
MSRKIIMIVPRGEKAEGLAALCDDGSVFVMNVPGYWVRVNTATVENYVEPVPLPPTAQ